MTSVPHSGAKSVTPGGSVAGGHTKGPWERDGDFFEVCRDVVAACRGEQEHFEAWAKLYRYDMSQHPLHYIFTDPKTDAARMGWKAALAYVHDAAEPLAAAPAPSSLAGGTLSQELIELAIHKAIRDEAGPGLKMLITPRFVKAAADTILAALSPEAPARETEEDVEDTPWPESPLATALFRHVQSQFSLYDDEASEEAGEIIAILVKHGVDPTKLPALTPRHEAPAGKAEYVDAVGALSERTPEAPAEGAGEADVLVTMRDHYQFALKGPWPEIKTPNYALAGLFKMAGDEIERLRARSSAPEAREDAQPFAWAYRLNFPDENTAWDWQAEKEKMTEAKFGQHGGILETMPLYTHPAAQSADKLRIAVEALEKISTGTYEQGRARTIARQALAALKGDE